METQRNAFWRDIVSSLIVCSLFLLLPSCSEEDDWLSSEVNFKSLSIEGDLYYGPETFARTSGKPFIETRLLENLNFECFDGKFILKIQNGNNKKTRVSSAEIWIDGLLIVSPSGFSKNISTITKQLSGLTPESILEVKLNGTPGGVIYLWIEGTLEGPCCGDIIYDIEGNAYKTVKIGNQCWMAENLKTTKYNDGTEIPLVTGNAEWANLKTPAYCWYNNDIDTYINNYGALYNFYAVNTGKLCPTGWHASTDEEWHQMALFLDPNAGLGDPESLIAGGKLKETGTTHWKSPNTGATNEVDFTALPGGYRNTNGAFNTWNINGAGWWWCTNSDINHRWLNNNKTDIKIGEVPWMWGLSVRCLKDN